MPGASTINKFLFFFINPLLNPIILFTIALDFGRPFCQVDLNTAIKRFCSMLWRSRAFDNCIKPHKSPEVSTQKPMRRTCVRKGLMKLVY